MANIVAKNESADNQAVSARPIDIRDIKDKKDNIYKKTPSTTTKKKKKKEEEEFFYEKKIIFIMLPPSIATEAN